MKKKIGSALVGAALLVGAGAMSTPASASGFEDWLNGSDNYYDCYYNTTPSDFSLQHVEYEKWCRVDFNPVTTFLRDVNDNGRYKVQEGYTDIYDTNFERTYNTTAPFMVGQKW